MAELIEIEVPEFVAEYLAPISENSPVGTDSANDPDYFKLSMEIPKTVPEYKNWIEFSNIILKEKSKDIKVASWLVFALYRTDKLNGLKNGLNILLHLLKKYGNDLYPSNPSHKSKAIQFIASTRVTKLLENEPISNNNSKDLSEIQKILNELTKECEKIFAENVPVIYPLIDVIDKHIKEISLSKHSEIIEKNEAAPAVVNKQIETQVIKPIIPAAPAIIPTAGITTEKDASAQLRKTIALFFEYYEENEKKQRMPENIFVFNISRQIQWSSLVRPIDNGGITSIEAPNKVIQGLIKDWFKNNNYDMLIVRVESEFIKENSEFRFWLDAQRYEIQSLEKKGGNYKTAADDIKKSLSRLLKRIPDLMQLKYRDKQTPFADPETIKWLNEEIINLNGSNSTSQNIFIPPILSEDYQNINKEYETICDDTPDNFENNLLKMQSELKNEESNKGKFLRKINLADYYFRNNEYRIARIKLLELKEIINKYHLSEWEQALCTAVWKILYQTNKEILNSTKDDTLKKKLELEQEELFFEIAKYDGVLALKLNKQKK